MKSNFLQENVSKQVLSASQCRKKLRPIIDLHLTNKKQCNLSRYGSMKLDEIDKNST